MWGQGRVPLNSQWPVLKNGGADFHHCWFVGSISKNVLGLLITWHYMAVAVAWLEHFQVFWRYSL